MSLTSGGTAPNGCSAGGRSAASAGSAGIVMTLSTFHSVALAVPAPHRGGQVRRRDHDADESPGRLGVVRGPQLQHHLVLGAEVDRLQVPALGEVPEVELVAVLLAEQQFGHEPVLDHRRRAPLAGHQDVLVEVPPGVVGQVLRPAVGLPGAEDVEGAVVEQRDAARPVVPVGSAQAGEEDAVRTAVQGVRPGVAGPLRQLLPPRRSCAAGGSAGRAGCRRRGCASCAGPAGAGSGAAARPRPCRGPRA